MLALALMIAAPASAQVIDVNDRTSVAGVITVADDDFGGDFPFEDDDGFGDGFPFGDDDDGMGGGDDDGMDDDDDDGDDG